MNYQNELTKMKQSQLKYINAFLSVQTDFERK